MRILLRIFSHNWGIKLLALVLAFIVYYSMKESIRTSSFGGMSPMKGTFNDRPQSPDK